MVNINTRKLIQVVESDSKEMRSSGKMDGFATQERSLRHAYGPPTYSSPQHLPSPDSSPSLQSESFLVHRSYVHQVSPDSSPIMNYHARQIHEKVQDDSSDTSPSLVYPLRRVHSSVLPTEDQGSDTSPFGFTHRVLASLPDEQQGASRSNWGSRSGSLHGMRGRLNQQPSSFPTYSPKPFPPKALSSPNLDHTEPLPASPARQTSYPSSDPQVPRRIPSKFFRFSSPNMPSSRLPHERRVLYMAGQQAASESGQDTSAVGLSAPTPQANTRRLHYSSYIQQPYGDNREVEALSPRQPISVVLPSPNMSSSSLTSPSSVVRPIATRPKRMLPESERAPGPPSNRRAVYVSEHENTPGLVAYGSPHVVSRLAIKPASQQSYSAPHHCRSLAPPLSPHSSRSLVPTEGSYPPVVNLSSSSSDSNYPPLINLNASPRTSTVTLSRSPRPSECASFGAMPSNRFVPVADRGSYASVPSRQGSYTAVPSREGSYSASSSQGLRVETGAASHGLRMERAESGYQGSSNTRLPQQESGLPPARMGAPAPEGYSSMVYGSGASQSQHFEDTSYLENADSDPSMYMEDEEGEFEGGSGRDVDYHELHDSPWFCPYQCGKSYRTSSLTYIKRHLYTCVRQPLPQDELKRNPALIVPYMPIKVGKRFQKKRRKPMQLGFQERWNCPFGCGKYYRRTSTKSIQRHQCEMQSKFNARALSSASAEAQAESQDTPTVQETSPAVQNSHSSSSSQEAAAAPPSPSPQRITSLSPSQEPEEQADAASSSSSSSSSSSQDVATASEAQETPVASSEQEEKEQDEDAPSASVEAAQVVHVDVSSSPSQPPAQDVHVDLSSSPPQPPRRA